MREVLRSEVDPVYCDSHALSCIHAARKEWVAAGLLDNPVIQEGERPSGLLGKGLAPTGHCVFYSRPKALRLLNVTQVSLQLMTASKKCFLN